MWADGAIFALKFKTKHINKMKKIGILALAATLLFGSCTTSDQFSAAAGGGIVGGMIGSTIGWIFGGPRGSDAGSLVGVVAGAAIGAVATSPEVRERNSRDYDYSSDTYNRQGDVHYSTRAEEAEEIGREYANLEIVNLRFIDDNNNHAIDAGESSKIVFEVKNNGVGSIYNVAPAVAVSGSKHIVISPTAVIGEIPAGGSVRYSAEVFANKKLRDGEVEFTISFVKRNYQYTMTTFNLDTRARQRASKAKLYR